MKRNNYFMLAYILFIGFCIFARLFVEFESWGRLVAAITCSSWFFAMADSHSSDVEHMQEYVDITTNYAKENIKSINTIISGLQERLAKLKCEPESDSKAIAEGEQLVKDLEEIKPYFHNKEKEAEKKRTKIKRSSFASALYTVTGFFAFFLIMTFNTVARIAEAYQDYLTVVAFGAILLTQYFAPLQREQNAKKQAEFEEIIQHFKDVSARYEKSKH